MSLPEWGIHLLTAESKPEANELVRLCNVALSAMPLTHDEKMAIEFHYKQIVRHRKTYYIYARNLPERYHATMLRPQRS